MQDIQSIQNLLTQVNLITKKYDEIAKHTGENYNIFQIIGKQSDELTHSKIIGDLLNPKGAHGLGDELLKEFLKIVGISNFETQNAKIEIEKHIGYIPEDFSEGGRIDLYISNGSQEIIIENKIYAKDQVKQLERYQKAFPNAQIIYLTLWPKNIKVDCIDSVGGIDLDKVKIINATYSENITNWLKESLKHSVRFPLLRETLYQYLNLINILTEQSSNEDMAQDLINIIIANPDNFKSANEISNSINHAKIQLISENFINLHLEVIKELNLNLTIDKQRFSDFTKKYQGFDFQNPSLTNLGLSIGFEFENPYFTSPSYGLRYFKSIDNLENENIVYRNIRINAKENIKNWNGSNLWWLFYLRNSNYSDNIFEKIIDKSIKLEIKEIIMNIDTFLKKQNIDISKS